MGFRHRLALFLVVTLAAVQLLTALVAYSYLRNSLFDQARSELTTATDVFQRQLGLLSERVADDVQVLSLDYALRQAIAQQDHDTELSALRNHGRRVGATRMMLVGLDGKISADTGAPGILGNPFVYTDLLDDSSATGERTALATMGRKIYWVVVAPVRAPVPIAFIAAWIPIDDAMLGKLAGLSNIPLSIALASNGSRNGWSILARTKSGPASAALLSTWPSGTSASASASANAQRGEYFTVATTLNTARHSAPVIAVLGYPLAEAFSAYRAIVLPVLFFLGFALLLAVACAMLVVRNASRPLEALAATARRIARGDYTPPPQLGAMDEIGQLSDALTVMARSISDREAALTSMIGALEIARNEAVKASEVKSQFLANMSHELRTPLNAIVGFGEMLDQEILGPLGVLRYREYANDILASAQRLLGLVSRMLDLAEVETGRFTIERKPISATDALQQAVAAIGSLAEREGVQLRVLKNAIDAPDIDGDADKLRQALTSILHNAVKFTPAGGSVTVSLEHNAAEIAIRIADNGVGMTQADVEVVTRPFHRRRSALDGQHQGAGLGLPFAKTIVEMHHGVLTIESVPGAGTTVEIRLPAMGAKMSDAA